MKINSGLWKPDVPSPLLPILKYDFLFAMKIWNLMLVDSGKWPLCSVSPSPGTNRKVTKWPPAHPWLTARQGAHSTLVQHNGRVFILVTALTISTGHSRVWWAHYEGGEMLCNNYCLWSRSPGPWVLTCNNGIYQTQKTNLEMSEVL